MANRTIRFKDSLTNTFIDLRVRSNNDGSYSQVIEKGSLDAGEDLVKKVLGITEKPVSGQIYASTTYVPASKTVTKDYMKPSPGNLKRFCVDSIYTSALLYIHFFNKTSAPANGDTPVFIVPLTAAADSTHPVQKYLGSDYFDRDWFTTGIAWGFSSTRDTFTGITDSGSFNIKGNFT